MKPGLEHPEKQRTRTGTSGVRGPGLERPGKKRPGIGTSGATEGGGYDHGEKRRGENEQRQVTYEEGHEEQESGSGRRRRRRRNGQKHGTRTGTTGEATHLDWNIQGRGGPGLERPGLREEEEAAAAKNRKESMNKSKERWRERTRRTRDGKREEKEKRERRTSTWNPDWNIRGRNARGLEHPDDEGPGLECPG